MAPTRPAADADARERLLRAGNALAQQMGLKALTVRAVAAKADVNLGSFVYHFGTRDAFVEALIERCYAPMFDRLRLVADQDVDALQALRQVILQLIGWAIDNRTFLARLVLDAGAGEGGARRFLRTLDARHPALLLQLIVRAQQGRQLRTDDPMHQMLFLMSALALPVMVFQLASIGDQTVPAFIKSMSTFATDPAQVEQRLDWALRGLAP